MTRFALSGLAVVGLVAMANAQVPTLVTGTVVDADGKPVVGALVGQELFNGHDGQGTRLRGPQATTDAEGKFRLEIRPYGDPALVTFDRSGRRGTVAFLKAADLNQPITLRVAPMVSLKARISSPELPDLKYRSVMVMTKQRQRIAEANGPVADLSVEVPPGDYDLLILGSNTTPYRASITVPAGKTEHDLGDVKLEATELVRLKGKPAPELTVTDARGVPKTVQLSDFKGKWVALEFWGYWCGPCVSRGLPVMAELQRAYSAHRDKFQVIAVHDKAVQTIKELDPKIGAIRERYWGGRDLPFPVVVDGTGDIATKYGIKAWPTMVLIDPLGRVAGHGGPEILLRKLPPLEPAAELEFKLNGTIPIMLSPSSLGASLNVFREHLGMKVELDDPALSARQVALDDAFSISNRSLLALTVEAAGAGYRIDGDTIRIGSVPRKHAETPVERAASRRLGRLLGQPIASEIRDLGLRAALAKLSEGSDDTILINPAVRSAAGFDADVRVVNVEKGVPLRTALDRILKPLGLRYTIRQEVIIVER